MADLLTTEPKAGDSKNNLLFKWCEQACGFGVAKFSDSDNTLLRKILNCTIATGGNVGGDVDGGDGGGGGGPNPPQVVADFVADVLSGDAPLQVTFTNLSTGSGLSYAWDFGDGNLSTATHPVHTYAAGTYTVTLVTTGTGGVDSETKIAYITVVEPAVVADFVADVVSGDTPLTVTFTNLSTGNELSYEWDFGDGTTSTSTNPVHVYNTVGPHTVTLVTTGSTGSDEEEKIDYIVTTGLLLDWQSDLGVIESAGSIVTWEDQTANNNDGTPVGGSTPVWIDHQLNDYPAVRFDGVDDSISSPTFASQVNGTFYVVFKRRSTGAHGLFDVDPKFAIETVTSPSATYRFKYGTLPSTSGFGPLTDTNPHIFHATINVGQWHAWVDNVLRSSVGTIFNPGTYNKLVLAYIGAAYGPVDFFYFRIYNRVHTSGEIAAIYSTIAAKYAL